ncbi:hypothetical protein R1flu_002600 [Riccia fluitans]|uniref:Uncharacterized protein n=1 Tax=Riccia fluitans TaxID=41844 RepID=A0ABD1Y6L9_9MARC
MREEAIYQANLARLQLSHGISLLDVKGGMSSDGNSSNGNETEDDGITKSNGISEKVNQTREELQTSEDLPCRRINNSDRDIQPDERLTAIAKSSKEGKKMPFCPVFFVF